MGFEHYFQNYDNSWRMKKVKTWLDALEKGKNWNLRRHSLE